LDPADNIVTRIEFCLFIDQFLWTFILFSSVTCVLCLRFHLTVCMTHNKNP